MSILKALPGAHLILLPDPPRFTIAGASNAYLNATFLKGDDAIGRGLFETNTDNPNNPHATGVKNLRASLGYVLEHNEEHRMADQRYDIQNPATGQFELRVWRPLNTPVLDEEGRIEYIIHSIEDVTNTIQLQEAEQAINRQFQQSEAKYRNLFEALDQGFCLIELIFDGAGNAEDYRFLEVNPVFEQQTGLKEAVGKTARELVPGLEPYWFERYGKVARTGEPIRFVEGSEAMGRWFEVYAFRIEEYPKVALLFTDITGRKKAEEALRQSENNLRNIILQAPVAMGILKGPSFVVELANERLYELWGRGAEDLANRSIFEGLPEVRDQGYEELLVGVYTTGKSFSAYGTPVSVPRNAGIETIYINLLYEAFREGDGTISGVMVLAAEVTDLVMANLKVEESYRELQFVMDFMPQMVWYTQPDGTADFFNQVYQDYTGLSSGQLRGKGWTAVIHPDDAEASTNAWKEALAGRNDLFTLEHRLRGKDGQYRWFLSRGIPLRDEGGAVVKWYGTSTNIELQKAAEVVLEQRVEERTAILEQRNSELQQFAYVSHHDLQEPLRKILVFGDMVKSDSYERLTEASRIRLDKMLASARRMRVALQDILNFASLDKEEEFIETDLNEILVAVQLDLELAISETGARLTSEPLPTIKAVPHQMQQLFYNLIGNALKFSKPGERPLISITCRLSGAREKDQPRYEIAITDNGIGFQSGAAEKIFEIFQRLHSKEDYAGTGIGLALCKKVVQNHGGKIWAEGRPGTGATFKVLLPGR
ncbi:PAS domain-containing protein [Paraflavisolibacter sp. H34]|uniref:PAS domain-containing sensor histidine kinase n=1 Tax=Huijunlia imazamoxiresistens TaxID=3127457 RepID=UPI003016E75B